MARKDTIYKGWTIHSVSTADPKKPYYRVWGLGLYKTVAEAKRAITRTGEKGPAAKKRKKKR